MSDELHKSRKAGYFANAFWITFFTLGAGTVLIALLPVLVNQPSNNRTAATVDNQSLPVQPSQYAIQSDVLKSASIAASITTNEEMAFVIDQYLERLFAPVAAAVPAYAEFHYSVIGEYSELFTYARTAFSDKVTLDIERILYANFDSRLNETQLSIDAEYAQIFQQNLENEISGSLPVGVGLTDLSDITQSIINDTLHRAKLGAPLFGATAFGAAVIAKTFGLTLAAKVAVKAGIKTAGKAGASATGATSGALIGTPFGGPIGAAAGGIIGGLIGWFGADAVIVNIDEHFNSAEFQEELNTLIAAHKQNIRAELLAKTALKTANLKSWTINGMPNGAL